MPPVFKDAVTLPIPKSGNTDLSQPASYRGIAPNLYCNFLFFVTSHFYFVHIDHVLNCNLMDNLTLLDALVISVSKQVLSCLALLFVILL